MKPKAFGRYGIDVTMPGGQRPTAQRQGSIARALKSKYTTSKEEGALLVTRAPHKDLLVGEVLCPTQ